MSTVTWTAATFTGAYDTLNTRATGGASASGSGDDAPTSSDGLDLAGMRSFTVHIEASGSIPALAGAYAYLKNPVSGNFNRTPRFDFICVGGATAEAFDGFDVAADVGRLAYIPFSIGAACTVYIIGVRR